MERQVARPNPLAEVLSWAQESPQQSSITHSASLSSDSADSGSTYLDLFVAKYGLRITKREPYKDGLKLLLAECPFNPEHRAGSAAFFVGADQKLGFRWSRSAPKSASHLWLSVRRASSSER